MVVVDMQGRGEGVGTTRCAVTVAASIGTVVGSTVFEQGRSAQVNAQGRVVRLGHEARQIVMEEAERLEAVAFYQWIHGRVPEMA
jgi:hypothetical protein